MAIKIARQLQSDIPHIADDYRKGLTCEEIIDQYKIDSNYGLTKRIAQHSVQAAIRGHYGGFGFQPFDGLIKDISELERLAQQHYTDAGKKRMHSLTSGEKTKLSKAGGDIGGRRVYELKAGIHARTTEERQEWGKKYGHIGGSIGGKRTYERRLGIHALTSNERKWSGRQSAINRGQVPWIERIITDTYCVLSEIEFAYKLSQIPEFRRRSRINNQLITDMLNELYHNNNPVRTSNSVGIALAKYRKTLSYSKPAPAPLQ